MSLKQQKKPLLRNIMTLFSWHKHHDVFRLKNILQQGTVVLSTTDTVMGLLALPTQHGVDALRRIKKNKDDKPYLLLIAKPNNKKIISVLESFVDCTQLTPPIIRFIERCWPGPLTILFQAHIDCPHFLTGPHHTIALRCPDHQGLQQLLAHFSGLLSTSANMSGEPTPSKFSDVSSAIMEQIDYSIIDHSDTPSSEKSCSLHLNKASTILDCSGTVETQHKIGPFGIVREGAYTSTRLQELYEASTKS